MAAFTEIERVLGALMTRMVAGISAIDGVNPLGSARVRTSTLSFTVEGITPDVVAKELARRRIAVWAGDNYAYELMGRYGLAESGGAIRASIVLYNSQEDVDRFVTAVREIAATSG